MIKNPNHSVDVLDGRSDNLQIPHGNRSSNLSTDTSRFRNKFQKRCSGPYLSPWQCLCCKSKFSENKELVFRDAQKSQYRKNIPKGTCEKC